ncbi:EAL and HDOD domain-containing protein [Comamonas sp. GB3 AK4-5]|uniref:EAL and HDOD domain-containing protein n=1 Tax=Comamonas sp. GB3 AK4-5 TaxID=3231487 RepID=UPI00351EB700
MSPPPSFEPPSAAAPPPAAEVPRSGAMIARQAIVNQAGDVVAYELFSRSRSPAAHSAPQDVSLIFAALAHTGGEDPVNFRPLFVKCSHESMASGQLELVSPERVVLEVASLGSAATSEVQARLPILRALRLRGFRLAFTHTVLESAYAAWLQLADYIKLDLGVLRDGQLAVLVGYAQRHTPAQIVAERVDSAQQHAMLQSLGIRYFQGFPFARPAPVQARMLAPAQGYTIQLINLLRQQAKPEAIEEVLKKDAGLSFNLMRLINSAGLALAREITSFRQAVLLLGLKKLFRWAALLLMASKFGDLPSSVGQTAVVRGRLMELLALELLGEEEADQAFVVGVFSLLDMMLHIPMPKALQLVQVPDAVSAALLRREGVLGELLTLVQACEDRSQHLHHRSATLSRLSDAQINHAHLQALAWMDNLAT